MNLDIYNYSVTFTVSSVKQEPVDRLKSPPPSINVKEEDRLSSLCDSQPDTEYSIEMDAKTILDACK